MRQRLRHGCPLCRHIPHVDLGPALGTQPTQGQELIDVRDGVLLRGTCLIDPQGAERIKGIGIQIGQRFALLSYTLCLHLTLR
jgi:hypothetical protein